MNKNENDVRLRLLEFLEKQKENESDISDRNSGTRIWNAQELEEWANQVANTASATHDVAQIKTFKDLQAEIHVALSRHHLTQDIDSNLKKLREYKYVDEICDLERGKYVRWIRIESPQKSLTNGGIITDIKFTESGVNILCKNSLNRFIQYKFEECLTFQKLSTDELIVLSLLSKE